MLLNIFNMTSKEYGMSGITGYNYEHLKDNIRWAKLSRRKYTPVLMRCLNSYIKGVNSKK